MNTPEPTGPRKITAEDPPQPNAADASKKPRFLNTCMKCGGEMMFVHKDNGSPGCPLPTAPATPPATETPEQRIGGWRITPEGLKMNGPTPPTQEGGAQ